jgi:hypothetical protein
MKTQKYKKYMLGNRVNDYRLRTASTLPFINIFLEALFLQNP